MGIAALGMTALTASAQSAITLTTQTPTVTQNFDEMWDAQTSQATLALPDGWRVDRNLDAPRQIGAYDEAATEVMYSGGVSLASNAKNGTWNFGSSAQPTDRAVGGLSTTVSGGTRCISVMTKLHNGSATDISRLSIDYDIEKYRYGANTAGFTVQLYYSADGENWTSGGDDFYTWFTPDSETIGAEDVPISTTSINGKNLLTDIDANSDLYLAWNITVASGSSPDKAPGLAIDNVSITANYGTSGHYIYVEDNTGWNSLAVYETSGKAFGEYPGSDALGYTIVNGVSYKAFEYITSAPFDIEINNTDDIKLPKFTIDETRDYYLCVTDENVTEITDPQSYTGYVDPDAPKPSGIYLRGEVNGWDPVPEWEFGIIGNGVYALYDKQLSGGFKISDANWSSSCNYGTNGSTILMDQPYQLESGTDDNISCGSNAYTCKRIVLTITDEGATLLLESDDSTEGLTQVYVIGDNNGWNYMDASGALALDETDGLFKGRISLPSTSDGYSHWRIYQRLGMGGAWGAPGGENMTGNNTHGTLEQGSTGNVSTASGTYDFTFNLNSGEYSLTKVSSAIAEVHLLPQEVVLVPELPEKVKILSLNNSLIYYNDQDVMFNEIAAAMGKDAVWTKHTLLGKSLETHWNEGDGLAEDGTPSAKMLVRSEAWSHIILQEQSSLPRTDIETFRASVKKWIDYIREYCPNPNAIIILPMNWAYEGDWENFTSFNDTFRRNYLDVARELGVVVCPVAMAYQNVFDTDGEEACSELFLDDRHPTPKATYMAACMEYSLIFDEDASTITYHPESVTDEEAKDMADYASRTMAGFTNYVNHNQGTISYTVQILDEFGMEMEAPEGIKMTVSGGGSLDSNNTFTSDGTLGNYTVTATMSTYTSSAKINVTKAETVVVTYPSIELNEDRLEASEDFNTIGTDADAQLPEAWRIDRQTVAPRTLGTFPVALQQTMYAGGENLPSNAKNGLWNFGADGSDDRAIGGITTGVDNGTRAINIYAHLYNSGKKTLENVTVSYDIEKYRKGSNSAGFAVQLYYSIDGRNWTSAGTDFYTKLEPDDETAGYAAVPGETITVSDVLPATIGGMCDLYLAWNISVASGDAANAAMALGIDNFSISAQLPEVPTALHYIYVIDNTGWASLGLYAWGDGELFGAWPGEAPIDEREIDGTTYKVFALDTDDGGTYNLIFNNWNQGKQLKDYTITANRDFYFEIDETQVTEISRVGIDEVGEGNKAITYRDGTISAPAADSITVYSISGTAVARTTGDLLDVNALPSGAYIVKASGITPATSKIVK